MAGLAGIEQLADFLGIEPSSKFLNRLGGIDCRIDQGLETDRRAGSKGCVFSEQYKFLFEAL